MAHLVETMAYANELPWHGLGNNVDPNVSIDEMLVQAGLNWEVKQHPCFTEVDGVKVEIGRHALVRETDKRVLTVTGENWKPFQNKDALDFFKEYTAAGGAKLETAGSLRGGKVIWGLANIQKGFTLNGRDKVNGYVLLISPHEVGNSISVRTTSVRVVCANTMAMAEKDQATYRQSHLKEFDVAAARETIQIAQEQVALFEMEAKTLQNLKMSEYDTVRLLAKHFQPVESVTPEIEELHVKTLLSDPTKQMKVLKNILHSVAKAPGATPGNGWGVLNGVTHWADHVAGREADARMFRSWLGHTGKSVQKVRRELVQMAA